MRGFYFSCPSKPVGKNGESLKGHSREIMNRDDLAFHRQGGSTMGTYHPLTRAALYHLSGIWPERLHFKKLLTIARENARDFSGDRGKVSQKEEPRKDADVLAEMLLTAYSANIVELHAHNPRFIRKPGDRPVASALSRYQANKGSQVTNLCHRSIDLENTYGRILLPLLNGTRDIDAIRRETLETIRSKNIPLNGKYPSEKTTGELTGEIDSEIENCARYALLEA
jgi:methyltransferase-like protein